MIRFLQTDNRLTKALLVVIIGAASISMVVYLIPGLAGGGATAPGTFATILPHWYNRFFASGDTISQQRVEQEARRQLMQRNPAYADNPMILQFVEQQVGQQLVQQQVLLDEADKLGVTATDADVRNYLHTGPTGQVLFPNGNFIGQEVYARLISERLNMSVKDFEDGIKKDIIIHRLQALVTAGVSVGDQEVRDTYRKQNLKIKFDYAVLSSDDLRKSINPSDSDLQGFFKKNLQRYASAVPEQRLISYFSFTPDQVPGGVQQPSQQEVQQYYQAHQAEYQVQDQARARHILVKVAPNADPKTDAAAKAKAEGIQKQLQSGGNWTDLAKKNSDDPGSKDSGGELGFSPKGRMVPEFDKAIFGNKVGDVAVIKTQFGYHVVQVEERQTAHAQQLSEVLPTIQATLIRQKSAASQENFAKALAAEAVKNGLAKTAAAHHLELATSQPVTKQGVIAALPDSTALISKAFDSKQSDPAQYAATGEGYAIFQVSAIAGAHAPSFADWKSHIADDYRDDQLPGLLAQKTTELATKAHNYNDLAKAAKEVGATVKQSDLVSPTGQVPDLGQVAQVAPQLLSMNVGNISGPINAQRTGVVAKIVDKQEPSADEIAKNFDQTREQLLDQRRNDAFSTFMSGVLADYKKHNRIRINAEKKGAPEQGM
ncbi:peptidylprolyl isomerase [Telmatobacter bradus]|uniref:peptidylprolyl isomerase n=1 Tax=Telmatobacter bradus TaxID=474953 RepID=UPI003B42E079